MPVAQPWWQRPWLAPAAVVVIGVVVLGIALISRGSTNSSIRTQPASASLTAAITSIPDATLVTVGDGGLTPVIHKVTGQPALTAGGKPQVLYVGADWCPFCAAERWSLVVALSRFGTVGNLYTTASSTSDTDPDTHTLSLAHLTYSSQYLDVAAVETQDRDQNTLQTPTDAQTRLMTVLDAPPYTSTAGGIPFIDIGNQYVQISSGYSPGLLQGLDWDQIAAAMKDPASPVARAILGHANLLTAAICKATGDQPPAVCTQSPVTELKLKLPTAAP